MASVIFQPIYEHGRVTLAFVRDSGARTGETVAKQSVPIEQWELFLRAELEAVAEEKRRLRANQESRQALKRVKKTIARPKAG